MCGGQHDAQLKTPAEEMLAQCWSILSWMVLRTTAQLFRRASKAAIVYMWSPCSLLASRRPFRIEALGNFEVLCISIHIVGFRRCCGKAVVEGSANCISVQSIAWCTLGTRQPHIVSEGKRPRTMVCRSSSCTRLSRKKSISFGKQDSGI